MLAARCRLSAADGLAWRLLALAGHRVIQPAGFTSHGAG